MARKHEAVSLLQQGFSPPQIAEQMGISLESVMGYLYNQVGEGKIKRSDILFSFPKEQRREIEKRISNLEKEYDKNAAPFLLTAKERYLRAYVDLRDARVVFGDMYEIIREIEVFLHTEIRKILIAEYGQGEHGWWRRGIPLNVRDACVRAREADPEPAIDQYCYTTLTHLMEIVKVRWNLFLKVLPDPLKDKQSLLADLDKLNRIRNSVMHPVRGLPPTEDDFEFLRDLRGKIGLSEWPFTWQP